MSTNAQTAQVLPLRALTETAAEPRAERRPHKDRDERGNDGDRSGILVSLEGLIANQVIAYPMWYSVFQKLVQRNFSVMPQILYTFVETCPREFVESSRDLAREMVSLYGDSVMNQAAKEPGLSVERLASMVNRMRVYLQLASFYDATTYLNARTVVILLHKEVDLKLPQQLADTMDRCAGFHGGRGNFTVEAVMAAEYRKQFTGSTMDLVHPETGDRFSFPSPVGEELVAELEAAGYEMKSRNANQGIWVHPEKKLQRTVYFPAAREGKVTGDGQKLTGVALLDEEGIKKAQEAKAARHAKALAERRAKKKPEMKAPKAEKKNKKDKDGKKNQK